MRNRLLIRSFIVILIVVSVIGATWLITRARSAATPIESADNYFSQVVYRNGASTDDLIGTLQAHLKSAPNDAAAYSQLGLAYLQKVREVGDPTYYQKAEGVLKKALELQVDDYVALSAMGALDLARHQFTEALQLGDRARQLNPERTYAYGVSADAQIELGRYDDAQTTLQTMVNIRPDLSSFSRISYLRELNGDVPGALDMMQRAVDGGGPQPENSAWTRTQLGNLYFNTGDVSNAELEYQRTLQNLPNYVYALAGLGRVRFAQGRTDEAIKLMTQATQGMPLPEFVIALGDMYQAVGNITAAQQQYQLVGVIQKLYEANGVDLDLEIALFNADHDRDLAKTVEQARTGYAHRPSIYGADVLSWALYKAGQFQEAQKFSTEALRLGMHDALKYFHAGLIAKQLGDTAQAKQYISEALSLNPNFSILYAANAQAALNELNKVASK